MNAISHEQTCQNIIHDPEQCLTTGQAARELQVAPGTLQNWRCQGEGPRFIKHRRSIYYLMEDLIEYKNNHFKRFNSTSEWKQQRQD